MINREIFALRVNKLLDAAALSKVSLAKSLGITKQSLNSWLTGKALPTADKLHELAAFFNVSADYLLGLTDNPHINKQIVPDTDDVVYLDAQSPALTPEELDALRALIRERENKD